MADIITPEYISLTEAAASWSISSRTLRRLVESGDLEGFRIPGGRTLRVRRVDVDNLFQPVAGEEN